MPPKWDSVKNEIVFARLGPGGVFKYNFDFTFYIAVGEVPELAGEPLFPMLDAMSAAAERVLSATEAECRRTGILN